MWQFQQAIDGISEACRALKVPITGGNVSFYNDTLGKSIDPTPVLGVLGLLEDAAHLVTTGFRNEGDVIVLLDGLNEDVAGDAAKADSKASARTAAALREFFFVRIRTHSCRHRGQRAAADRFSRRIATHRNSGSPGRAKSLLSSAHDLSDGGLAVSSWRNVASPAKASPLRMSRSMPASPRRRWTSSASAALALW